MSVAHSVRFLMIVIGDDDSPTGLGPAPSVRDWEEINEGLKGAPTIETVEELCDNDHLIRGSYRGWTMYLYPNVRFERSGNERGGHGFAGVPFVGDTEEVTLRMNDKKYKATVQYQ